MSAKYWINFILLGLIWGSSFMWIKIALMEVSPFTLVTFRVFFGVLGLLAVFFWRRPALPPKKFINTFVILGFFSVALPFALISWSEQHITSAMASILNSTVPLFTIIIATMFTSDDKMTPAKIIGLVFGFIGVVVLLSDKLKSTVNIQLMGHITMLIAAIAYAAGAVIARRATVGLTSDIQSLGQQMMAWLLITPVAVIVERPFTFPHQPITWFALAWLGLLGTALATMLYFSLIHSVGPTRTMLVSYIFPVVGVLLGIIFMNEPANWRIFIGSVLVISGVAIVNSKFGNTFRKSNPVACIADEVLRKP